MMTASIRTLTSQEMVKYIKDIAKSLNIDLSQADRKETEKILRKVPSLSKEIVRSRHR